MSRADVPSDHAEAVLATSCPVCASTYDRHEYYAEKKHAFAALAALADRILNPPADNVMPLRCAGE